MQLCCRRNDGLVNRIRIALIIVRCYSRFSRGTGATETVGKGESYGVRLDITRYRGEWSWPRPRESVRAVEHCCMQFSLHISCLLSNCNCHTWHLIWINFYEIGSRRVNQYSKAVLPTIVSHTQLIHSQHERNTIISCFKSTCPSQATFDGRRDTALPIST